MVLFLWSKIKWNDGWNWWLPNCQVTLIILKVHFPFGVDARLLLEKEKIVPSCERHLQVLLLLLSYLFFYPTFLVFFYFHKLDIAEHKGSLHINKSCCQSAIVFPHKYIGKQLRHFLSSRRLSADSLAPVTCCGYVCFTWVYVKDKPQLKMKFFGGIFVCVYMCVCVCVFSLNKTAGCGGRWQHVL